MKLRAYERMCSLGSREEKHHGGEMETHLSVLACPVITNSQIYKHNFKCVRSSVIVSHPLFLTILFRR